MKSFLFIINNEKEAQILKQAFEQYEIKVVISQPTFANYIQTIQTGPDLILLELPRDNDQQKKFVTLLKQNRNGKHIPILGYGSQREPLIIRNLLQEGINGFMSRPLKFGDLTQTIHKLVDMDKDIFSRRADRSNKEREEDFKFLMDPSRAASEKIEIMVGFVGKMLAFPFTVAKVVTLTGEANAGAGALAKAIEVDPVILATILKVSNTVMFASRDKEISNVKEAIVRIGFKETRNIALSLSVMTMFNNDRHNYGFDRKNFWYHSLAVGLIAEKLAKNSGYSISGEAFLTGLLHDFGIILLDEFFTEIFQPVMEETTSNGSCFVDEIEKKLGVSHNEVVELLFQIWNLPLNMGFAIKNQTKYQSGLPPTVPEQKDLTEIVGMANTIAKVHMLGHECDRYVDPVGDRYLKHFKSPMGITQGFLDSIYSQLNMYNKFLNLNPSIHFPSKELEIDDADKIKVLHVNRGKHLLSNSEGYLKTQGYKLTSHLGPEVPSKKIDTPQIAVIQLKDDDTVEDVQPFIEYLNNNEEKLEVPVTLIHPPGSDLKDALDKEGIELLPASLDLRRLDEAVAKARKKVPLLKGDPGGLSDTNGESIDVDADPVQELSGISSAELKKDLDKLTQGFEEKEK